MDSLFRLDGRIVIVTGASRGIGAAIGCGMVEMGAKVFGIARSFAPGSGSRQAFIPRTCDVTDAKSFASICHDIAGTCGQIDVLVNNAGLTKPGTPNSKYPLEDWNATLAVNLTAPFVCSQIVFDYMRDVGRGSIINVTSIGAKLGFPDNPAYQASKGGLRMLTRALANDWAGFGIRVNNLGPGYMTTDMTMDSWKDPKTRRERQACTMADRWGEPSDVVGTAIFLASDASGYVTGQDIYVDGGWTAKGLPDF